MTVMNKGISRRFVFAGLNLSVLFEKIPSNFIPQKNVFENDHAYAMGKIKDQK